MWCTWSWCRWWWWCKGCRRCCVDEVKNGIWQQFFGKNLSCINLANVMLIGLRFKIKLEGKQKNILLCLRHRKNARTVFSIQLSIYIGRSSAHNTQQYNLFRRLPIFHCWFRFRISLKHILVSKCPVFTLQIHVANVLVCFGFKLKPEEQVCDRNSHNSCNLEQKVDWQNLPARLALLLWALLCTPLFAIPP